MEPPRHLLRHVDPPLLAALAISAGEPAALTAEPGGPTRRRERLSVLAVGAGTSRL